MSTNIIVWILQGLLAVFFIMPGYGKISRSRERHIADGHLKLDGSLLPIRLLGVLELLGCVGIIVPWLLGVLPILTPLAAVGFCLVMIGGMVTHILRKEYKMIPLLLVVLAVASFVAYQRFSAL